MKNSCKPTVLMWKFIQLVQIMHMQKQGNAQLLMV
jgi:hypothetical protein